jgi:hypothetical protein
MAAPLVAAAAAAAAKIIAKKLTQRAVGGITAGGAKSVNPVYREMGTPRTIKINSGGTTPRPAAAPKPPSFSKNKDMPNLIKIDSAKGNTVKKIAYRKRSSN